MTYFKFERTAPPTDFLSTTLNRMCAESAYSANCEFGVELELEGFGAELMGAMAMKKAGSWVAHNDPSLRGDATELVLKRPMSFEEFTKKALPEFTTLKEESGFKPLLSNRCSVHVHLDFSHKTVYALCKFMTLYALMEDFFFRARGPERLGNHFCISLRENARFSEAFVKAIETQTFRAFSNENFRYMALNINSLWKFGSVEVRLHAGEANEERILSWVACLKEMLDFSTAFNVTPDDIIRQSSMHGLSDFIKKNLPTVWDVIKDVYYDSYEHTDTAQDFAFGVSWEHAPKSPATVGPRKRKAATGATGRGVEANLARVLDADARANHVVWFNPVQEDQF
jgi:hypothetical protein